MATAAFETPTLKPYPVIPLVAEGAMAHSKPFVASDAFKALLKKTGNPAACEPAKLGEPTGDGAVLRLQACLKGIVGKL